MPFPSPTRTTVDAATFGTGSLDAASFETGPLETGSLDTASLDTLRTGTRVEVRRRFDDRWARGFEVVAATPDHYRLRRLSDGHELPVLFPRTEVRRERAAAGWRF